MAQQNSLMDHFRIRRGQCTGLSGTDRTNVAVRWFIPGVSFAGAEGFGSGVQLDVGLQSNRCDIIHLNHPHKQGLLPKGSCPVSNSEHLSGQSPSATVPVCSAMYAARKIFDSQ